MRRRTAFLLPASLTSWTEVHDRACAASHPMPHAIAKKTAAAPNTPADVGGVPSLPSMGRVRVGPLQTSALRVNRTGTEPAKKREAATTV